MHTFEGHTEGISDIAWSSDGEFLASASDDKTVRIWSLESVRKFEHATQFSVLATVQLYLILQGYNSKSLERTY